MIQDITGTKHIFPKRGALLFFFAMAYFSPFVMVFWRLMDEGILVNGAQMVSQGALPYRDFFEIWGPGSFYWLGMFFKLFGTSILVARIILLLTVCLTIILLYWMTRRIYQGPFDLLPSLFFLLVGFPFVPMNSHHWDSNLFGLLAVGAFFLWQDRDRWWFLALAGVMSGLTSCFFQPKGLFLVVALALVVLVNSYRAGEAKPRIASHLGILLGGFAAVGALVVLWFWFAGGLSDLIYANLIWPLERYSDIGKLPYGYGLREYGLQGLAVSYFRDHLQISLSPLFTQVMEILTLIPFLFIVCLPFLFAGLTGVACLSKSTRSGIFNATMLPYWAAGLALGVSELHRADVVHLIYGAPLLLIIFLVVWNYCCNNKRVLKSFGLGLITVTVILLGCVNFLNATSGAEKIVTRRGVLYGTKDPALTFLIEHTKPGDYVFIYPYYPMYYFFADVKNPTRYSVLLYHYNTDKQFAEAIESLKQKHVKYVLWGSHATQSNLKILFPQYKQPAKDDLHLEQYLENHYGVIGIKNGFKIMRLRKDKTILEDKSK
jgi:4-amino-4-deoxy-L-arabinose transferase-like glycosyltransferase